MNNLLLLSLNLTPIEIGVITISCLGFIVMFGLASSKGGYQDLANTTLKNDEIRRVKNKNR